jgi:predicted DNA-binding transcriptional regulator YafY
LQIEYQSVGRPTPSQRILEPYGLAIYQSSIYVIAVESGRDEDKEPEERLRHWKLDRFSKADALDDWFKPDEDVDLQEHLGQSLGIFSGVKTTEYTIRLTAAAARWIQEDPWHPKQQLAEQSDGSFLLTVQAYQDTEVIQKVMFLGTEAEIIAPASCRKAIREIVATLSQSYAKNASTKK